MVSLQTDRLLRVRLAHARLDRAKELLGRLGAIDRRSTVRPVWPSPDVIAAIGKKRRNALARPGHWTHYY